MISKFIAISNYEIHTCIFEYEKAGENREKFILVHGLGVSSRYLMPLAKELAKVYSVYVLDFPGFGKSTKPDKILNIPELSSCMDQWMKALLIEHACFVGNSLGCQIIIEFASRHPERIKACFLIGPTMDKYARNIGILFYRWLRVFFVEPIAQLSIAFIDLIHCGPKRYYKTFLFGIRDKPEEKLKNVKIKGIIIRGEKDFIAPIKWSNELALLLEGGRVISIIGKGHVINYTAAPEVARVINTFLLENRKCH